MRRELSRLFPASPAIIRTACFVATALGGSAAFASVAEFRDRLPSPFRVVGIGPGGIGARLSFDVEFLKDNSGQHALRIGEFPIGVLERVDVDLVRVEPFASNAEIVVMGALNNLMSGAVDMAFFAGCISGEPESRVFWGVADAGSATLANGIVQRIVGGTTKTYILSSGPSSTSGEIVIFDASTAPPSWLRLAPLDCGAENLPPLPHAQDPGAVPASPRGNPPCRLATIAIETDQEYLHNLFGGNALAATTYVGTLIAAVSDIYGRDFNTRLEIGYLRLWQDDDPWDKTDAYEQMFQFRDYWNENMHSVQRNAVHFLSAREFSSANGLAFLGGLCASGNDYGLSTRINGFFPYPVQDNHPQNWDPFMVAHELGHNFGAPHTHSMSPPVDLCAEGDCSVCPAGTILSFCHECPGGLTNVQMRVHERSVDEFILPFLTFGASCNLLTQARIVQQPLSQNGCPGQSLTLSVAAVGSGALNYQWRRNGAEIAGATGATYVLASFTVFDTGSYDVIVSDSCGAATSSPAAVGVCSGVVGDLNLNCSVDIGDLSVFLTRFGTGYLLADFDGDGDVDIVDLAVILGSFGADGCQ
jgi:hypothetical protein